MLSVVSFISDRGEHLTRADVIRSPLCCYSQQLIGPVHEVHITRRGLLGQNPHLSTDGTSQVTFDPGFSRCERRLGVT